jgi:hypothetical protein
VGGFSLEDHDTASGGTGRGTPLPLANHGNIN